MSHRNFHFFTFFYYLTAIFKTYKLAVQKEVDGQKHSNLESQEESDLERAKNRKHPKTKFSCESDENSSEPPNRSKVSAELVKRPAKKRAKLLTKCAKEQAFSSDDSSDGNEYVFIKNVQKDLSNSTERIKESSTASSSILENANEVQTNEMAKKSSVDVQLVPDEATRVIIDNNTADIQTNEMSTSSSVDLEFMWVEESGVIFENAAEVQTNEAATTSSINVQLIPQQAESIDTGTAPVFLETIDFSGGVTDRILQKLSEVLQNQSDFKKVLVDFTYRMMKMEHQIKKITNTPVTAIYRQLALPIVTEEKYIEVQVALEDADNYVKLVSSKNT